jgi:hypothetical protein
VNGQGRNWLGDVRVGAAVYLLTSLPVFAAVFVGTRPGLMEQQGTVTDFLHGFCHYDGGHFESIIHDGYWYDPARGSNIAFFPGYPLAVEGVLRLSGCSTRLAMVTISNVSLCLSFIVLAAYLRIRFPDEPASSRLTILTLIGVLPAGFFFRMGYSESLFLLFVSLLLLGFVQRWPVIVLAVLAGALTGIRAVGLAAGAAVIVQVLADTSRGSPGKRVATAALLAPVTCWGLLAFMGYQQVRFGTPIAFALTQEHWSFYSPAPGDIPTKALRLALAEPIWNSYVPGSSRYWARFESEGMPVLGLLFWNPILFAIAVVAVIVGWRRGWLAAHEAILGLGLLLIPYATRADEMSMGSHARFAAVAIPAYVVIGRMLERLSAPARWLVLAALAALMTLWAALFAACWPLC